MIRPLLLKSIIFPNNLIQGPLAGYSCAPLRLLAAQYGNPAFCYSEMLSAKNLAHHAEIAPRYRFKDPNEGALCIQLSGNDPEDLAKASDRALSFGAGLLDLNCGCPVNKIRKKGAGSKLLEQPEHLKRLVKAMQRDAAIPISVKIRVDGDMPNRYSLAAALAAQEAGADFITVHGRHWSEGYDVACRQDQIAEIVSALTIPVVANGDVKDTASALSLLKNTGAAGVMIARAAVGQPWLFAHIQAEAQGQTFTPPSPQKIGELLLQHVQGLMALEGEKVALLQARKLFKYYARPLANCQMMLETINTTHHYEAFERLVKKAFG